MKLFRPCDCGKHYGNPMVGAFWTMVAFMLASVVLRTIVIAIAAGIVIQGTKDGSINLCPLP